MPSRGFMAATRARLQPNLGEWVPIFRWRQRCKRSVVRRLTDKEINVTPGDFRPPPHARWAWIGVTSAAAASFIAAQAARAEVNTIPGMPPVIDHQHIVSETTRSDLAPDM